MLLEENNKMEGSHKALTDLDDNASKLPLEKLKVF